MYDAVNDSRTRPQHLEWDGLVLPVDHPLMADPRPAQRIGLATFRSDSGSRAGPYAAPPAQSQARVPNSHELPRTPTNSHLVQPRLTKSREFSGRPMRGNSRIEGTRPVRSGLRPPPSSPANLGREETRAGFLPSFRGFAGVGCNTRRPGGAERVALSIPVSSLDFRGERLRRPRRQAATPQPGEHALMRASGGSRLRTCGWRPTRTRRPAYCTLALRPASGREIWDDGGLHLTSGDGVSYEGAFTKLRLGPATPTLPPRNIHVVRKRGDPTVTNVTVSPLFWEDGESAVNRAMKAPGKCGKTRHKTAVDGTPWHREDHYISSGVGLGARTVRTPSGREARGSS